MPVSSRARQCCLRAPPRAPVLWLAAAIALAQPQQIVPLETRSTAQGQRVMLDCLLVRPDAAAPQTVLVAGWRGNARLDFARRPQPVR